MVSAGQLKADRGTIPSVVTSISTGGAIARPLGIEMSAGGRIMGAEMKGEAKR